LLGGDRHIVLRTGDAGLILAGRDQAGNRQRKFPRRGQRHRYAAKKLLELLLLLAGAITLQLVLPQLILGQLKLEARDLLHISIRRDAGGSKLGAGGRDRCACGLKLHLTRLSRHGVKRDLLQFQRQAGIL